MAEGCLPVKRLAGLALLLLPPCVWSILDCSIPSFKPMKYIDAEARNWRIVETVSAHKLRPPIHAVGVPKINYREARVGRRVVIIASARASSNFFRCVIPMLSFSSPHERANVCRPRAISITTQGTHLRGTKFPTGSAATFRSPLSSNHPPKLRDSR